MVDTIIQQQCIMELGIAHAIPFNIFRCKVLACESSCDEVALRSLIFGIGKTIKKLDVFNLY